MNTWHDFTISSIANVYAGFIFGKLGHVTFLTNNVSHWQGYFVEQISMEQITWHVANTTWLRITVLLEVFVCSDSVVDIECDCGQTLFEVFCCLWFKRKTKFLVKES